jgi:hypothetical protein
VRSHATNSSAALRQGLERLRGAWVDCQASRDRNAIYGYLTAVYGLVAWWTAEGRENDRARRALRLQRLAVSDREDPFAAIIRRTADPMKADKRTRSKWSRVMRYASGYKPESEPLDQFIQRKGGINACAARSRCLGRGTWLRRRSAEDDGTLRLPPSIDMPRRRHKARSYSFFRS